MVNAWAPCLPWRVRLNSPAVSAEARAVPPGHFLAPATCSEGLPNWLCPLSRLSHRLERCAGKKPRPGLPLLASVRIHCPENPLRQRNIDSSGFIAELADVDVHDRPSPATIAAFTS